MKLTHLATFSTFIHAVLQEDITYGSDVIQISCFQKVGGTSTEMEDEIVAFGLSPPGLMTGQKGSIYVNPDYNRRKSCISVTR